VILAALVEERSELHLQYAVWRYTRALQEDDLPDLIMVDINLAGADGFDTARALRAQPGLGSPGLVGMTAADVSATDESAARAAGFDTLTTKPFTEAEFRRLVAAAPGARERRP